MDDLPRLLSPLIEETLTQSPAVGLLGPRQVGKSTLARRLAAERDAVYIDLQSPASRARLSDPVAFARDNAERLVVLDEVQLLPDLFAALRPLIDEDRRNGRFLLLGSAAPRLVRAASESLAGRILYFELAPLSFPEVTSASIDWRKHHLLGGYPQPLLHLDGRARQRWVDSYITTFLSRDLAELGIQTNAPEFERLLYMLAHVHGGTLNASSLSRSLKITSPTVQRYVDILEGAFLLRVLRPYYRNFGKRVTTSPRVYWRDSGLLHQLLGIRDYDSLSRNPALGASWEGYVIEELCRCFEERQNAFYYRTSNGAELDLILELGFGRRLAFEIKYGADPSLSKGNHNAIADVQPDRTYVITPDSERYTLGTGVEVCSLGEFLADVAGEWM